MRKVWHTPKEIAEILHFHISTIYRELKRRQFEALNSFLIEGLITVNEFKVSSGYLIRELVCRKYLKVCTLAMRVRKDDGFSSAFVDIATIENENDYPTMPSSYPCSIVTTDSGRCLGMGEVQINTDGKIKIRASDATINIPYCEASINCTWIIA